MKSVDTRVKILQLLKQGNLGVTEISIKIKLSNQIIHRYLKGLVSDKFIVKRGESPLTTYSLNKDYKFTRVQSDFEFVQKKLLPIFLKKYSKLNISKKTTDKQDLNFMLQSSAVYSSNIESVSIDLNSFIKPEMLSAGAKKEVSEVQDLLSAYYFTKSSKLTESNFLKSHQLLSRHLLSNSRQGKYRRESIGVFGSEGLVYSGPENFLVQNEIDILFDIINELLNKKMTTTEAIFWSSWLHLEIALIHPFLDGNGRVARLLEKWFMSLKLGDNPAWFLQTEHYYFKNRQVYYNNLRKAENYWEVDFERFEDFIGMLFNFLK